MANIHVLEQVRTGVFRLVMHIPIPVGNNSAGVSWRSIIAKEHGKTVLPDGDGTGGTISAAEKTQVIAGELLEVVAVEKGVTVANANAIFTRRSSELLADLQVKHAQYGRTI